MGRTYYLEFKTIRSSEYDGDYLITKNCEHFIALYEFDSKITVKQQMKRVATIKGDGKPNIFLVKRASITNCSMERVIYQYFMERAFETESEAFDFIDCHKLNDTETANYYPVQCSYNVLKVKVEK